MTPLYDAACEDFIVACEDFIYVIFMAGPKAYTAKAYTAYVLNMSPQSRSQGHKNQVFRLKHGEEEKNRLKQFVILTNVETKKAAEKLPLFIKTYINQ